MRNVKRTNQFFFVILIIWIILSIFFEIDSSLIDFLGDFGVAAISNSLSQNLLIVFLVCLIGNLLPFPTPYVLISWLVSSLYIQENLFIPLVIAFIASTGSLIGEITGYIVGKGAINVLDDETKEKTKNIKQILEKYPRLTPFLIWLFGITPLNDDLLVVPLGMMKYSFKKTIFFCWSGKFCMMGIISYLPMVFGLSTGYSFLSVMFPLGITILIIYLFLIIDFEVYLEKVLSLKLFKVFSTDEQ
jgi:membrane protein YqaA with SNARE-associated domain